MTPISGELANFDESKCECVGEDGRIGFWCSQCRNNPAIIACKSCVAKNPGELTESWFDEPEEGEEDGECPVCFGPLWPQDDSRADPGG